jgi:UDP-GlcNAc:undecaprenyl-phosphate GlcNAc-1-phosphate transferase
MAWVVLGSFLPAFIVSVLSTAMIRRLAPRLGLMDHPAARKVHRRATPLGGGIAIWLGVVLTLSIFGFLAMALDRGWIPRAWVPELVSAHLAGALTRTGRLTAILTAATLLMVVGLLDDLRTIGWLPRLLFQALLAAGIASSDVQLSLFLAHPWARFLLTVLWFMVLVNAFNFLDNMDALSGGVALLVAAQFAIVMLSAGDQPHLFVALLLLVLMGSLAGFLVFNWPPASIFMGDAGSYFVGMMLASATVVGTFYEIGSPRHAIMAPLCVLAVPLYDFASVVVIRLRQGRSPFHPDKSHFSHRLVELGLSPVGAVLTIYLTTLATGLGALLLYQVDTPAGATIVVSMVVCVLGVIAILETAGRNHQAPSPAPPEPTGPDEQP